MTNSNRSAAGDRRKLGKWIVAAAAVSVLAVGCGGDDANETQTRFKIRIENVGTAFPFVKSGAFNTPVGAPSPAPIGPGSAYEFSFTAPKGSFLSFATMFVPSNDFFFAPDQNGIALYTPSGAQISGDVTSQVLLWDAGTEINQEPGLGADQVQRQAAANTGAADPDRNVRLAPNTFGNLPAASAVIKVALTPTSANGFRVRIENVSSATTLATSDGQRQAAPLSPGAWVVHTAPSPLFSVGSPDFGQGLEAIAEDGSPTGLATALGSNTGITVPLSPGVWALHSSPNTLFTAGQKDFGKGLADIAQDGNPAPLAAALPSQAGVNASAAFNTPAGAAAPAPIGPGGAYEFTVTATRSQRLSLATMFVPSNDLFFAPDGQGIALHNADGSPFSGDVTAAIALWDDGTEVNQEPGVGPDQVQRQSGPRTGPAESNPVALVNDGFTYPPTKSVIKVTVTPLP